MSDVIVIANPTAGRGKGRRLLPRVGSALRALGVDHEVVVTVDGTHPERASRDAADAGASVVVSVGGDGLVSGCANGLIGTDTALAVVPAGTGNDFARAIGLDPKRPLTALALLNESHRRRIDAVRAEGSGWARHFICVAGCGFDSETNRTANSMRFLRGTARYLVAVFRTLARFRPQVFTFRIDGEEHRRDAMLLAVGNATSYGGGMKVCPDALVDDGLLDVTVVGAVSRATFVGVFPRVFTGLHVEHPAVSTYRGSKIEVDATQPFWVYGDGEPLGRLPATFTVLAGALEVAAP